MKLLGDAMLYYISTVFLLNAKMYYATANNRDPYSPNLCYIYLNNNNSGVQTPLKRQIEQNNVRNANNFLFAVDIP